MRILAFLQNPWFRPGTSERHIKMYRDDPRFHRKVLELYNTGKALRRAFGDAYDGIVWDNANPLHGETRDAVLRPDFLHMARRIAEVSPKLVLLFGRQAQTGWDQITAMNTLRGVVQRVMVLRAPHPMARGSANEHIKDDRVRYQGDHQVRGQAMSIMLNNKHAVDIIDRAPADTREGHDVHAPQAAKLWRQVAGRVARRSPGAWVIQRYIGAVLPLQGV